MKHYVLFLYVLLLSFLLAACTGRKQDMLSLFASIDMYNGQACRYGIWWR